MLAAGMAWTLRTNVGATLLHYNAAFLVTGGIAATAWPLLRHRRFATLAMAFTGFAATVTGFVMLYTRQIGPKDWITWWHSITSFAFLVLFLVHWLHNNVRLAGFTRRLITRDRAHVVVIAVAWLAFALLAVWTWGAESGRSGFTSDSYLALASWVVLAGVALPYGAWLVHRLPTLRARLAATDARNRARGLVDTSLFIANWAALLTGFALLYFAEPLRGGDLKYVSKWWHTATSVALLSLLTLHVGFNARLVAAHARHLDRPQRL